MRPLRYAPLMGLLDFLRGGDVVTGLTGVMHWSWAGSGGTNAWRVRPTASDPVEFEAAMMKALSIRAEHRFESMAEFQSALMAVQMPAKAQPAPKDGAAK